jgi:hypothetical protein|nr:MAG TPA: hypothetical protein [Caudoviricetes sp.]
MKQKDIDIYEILKDEEYGTELYTPKCGRVWHSGMANDKDSAKAIWTEDEAGREHFFYKNGKIYKEGEILLFPSKEMRDWSKFFKKGDVLVSEDGCVHIIFEKFVDYTYTKFIGKHYFDGDDKLGYSYISGRYTANTKQFRIEEGDAVQTYIKTIEEKSGGKLNRETLEIEKPEKLTFEIGKLYVFDEEDEDGKVTVIGKLIGKEEGELTIGNQYEIENEKFVTDEAFFLNISLHKELREATEGEILMFQKACTLWEKEKQAKEQPAFKPFDKVLVRCNKKYKWLPAFFVRDRGDEYAWRYKVLCIHSGKPADFAYCIPFEGHENIACTNYDIENLPF